MFSRRVAASLARLHKLPCDASTGPLLWKKVTTFINNMPENFADSERNRRYHEQYPQVESLRKIVEKMQKLTDAQNSPVVFCHNDLLLRNILYDDKTGAQFRRIGTVVLTTIIGADSVGFIDYEYAAPNYLAFDIANHFCEFAGVDEVDFARYPDRQLQLDWLRAYLSSTNSSEDVTDEQIEQLYRQVGVFAPVRRTILSLSSCYTSHHSRWRTSSGRAGQLCRRQTRPSTLIFCSTRSIGTANISAC